MSEELGNPEDPAAGDGSIARPAATPWRPAQRFTFPGSGGDLLAARLDLPPDEPVAMALFAHCFTCSQDAVAAARIARGLVAAGIGVLRFDFTGLGSSAGDFANTTFSSNVEDLVRASDALGGLSGAPLILIGHSLGGTAVLGAAPRIAAAAAVVTVNAPADPAHLLRLFPAETTTALAAGDAEVPVEIAGRQFRIRRDLLTDLRLAAVEEGLGRLRRPLLVLHAPLDMVVDVSNARRIYDAARHPKSFVALDGADHMLTGPGDGAYAASVIAAWAGRYLPVPSPVSPGGAPEGLREGEVTVRSLSPGALRQRVSAGRHVFVSDEPVGIGDDAGPTPYDLLLAALGTCTSMTLRLYADRKGWPLQGVSVRLRHGRHHAEDCEACESKPAMVDVIEREIELHGPLGVEQEARLLAIAERCPVHRTLTGDLRIVTRLSPPTTGVAGTGPDERPDRP